CDYASKQAFEAKVFGQFRMHKIVYRTLRESYGMSAQMAIRAVAQVSQSYKVERKTQHSFNPHSAMPYDSRILAWKGLDKVSILSLDGRLIIPVRIGAYQEARLDRKIRETDLILRGQTFYLAAVIDAPEPTPDDPVGTIGVDLGVTHLAVDNDGKFYSGEDVDKVRERTDNLKAKLQHCGTKSAKRHLRKLSGRESRFRRSVNHVISKKLVSKAKDTHCQIALEDLKNIGKSTVRKSQRRRHKSWAFNQLRQFITYKAAIAGVKVKLVDPRYTSQECPVCHHISKANRRSQSEFVCQSCGYASNADLVGATNIASRASVNEPNVSTFTPILLESGTKLTALAVS
ncbi:MAG: transposase, partial [Dehalococcoidales bacterium]|nr:transposase [Dehalococcoidales bacterium]